jgi:hypothetical protein
MQLCPDLSYFKKVRELETSLERTFYHNLMSEFDETMLKDNFIGDNNIEESLNDSMNLADNLDIDNLSSHSQRSSSLAQSPGIFEDNFQILNITNDFKKNLGPGISYVEGFSYLRSDDIKEYIQQFGDGNKELFKNIPQYKNFTKSFNQLEKLNNFGINNLLQKKCKKEELLFDFSIENEIDKNDIFEKDQKSKKNINNKDLRKDKKNKRRVRGFYYYDKLMLHNLFSIQDRHIQNAQNQFECQNDQNNDKYSQADDDINNEQLPIEEEKINLENFGKFDNEYEKKFGRLYKTFDVRVIKNKIWESISDYNSNLQSTEQQVDFKQIIASVSNNLSKEVLNNISTPTCFVCLLHLSNEKSN